MNNKIDKYFTNKNDENLKFRNLLFQEHLRLHKHQKQIFFFKNITRTYPP